MQASALRQGATIAAIGTAVYAQQMVLVDRGATSTGWLLLAAAAGLAAVAAWTRAPAAPAAALAAERADSRWMRLAWGAGAVAAVAATTILSAKEWWPVLALGLWLGGFALASLAVRGWRVGPQTRPDRRWSPAEVVALGALLALAAAARFAWIHDLPRLYFGDESRVAMFLHNEFGGERFPGLFRMGWNTWPVLGLAVQGIFAPLLGLHISALRLSSALVGTFAVLSTYLLARALFGTRTALVAAFLLAVNRTAIDFSRLSILHAQVLFIETLAFYFWWRAVNGGRAIHFLWAGIALGFCLFTYNAGQLAPPLLLSWMIVCALFAPRVVRSHWRGAALVLFGFFLALFPYLYYFTDGFAFGPNWGQWTIMARNRQTMSRVIEAWHASGFGPAYDILRRQVWTTWLGFAVLPGGGYVLGYRGGGMLDQIAAALFVLGLGMSVPRLLRPRGAFVPYWWLLTVIAGGIMTIDPPSVVRMVGLLPALAILAALPVAWLIRTAGRDLPRRAISVVLAVALLGGAAWENWRTYFVAYAAQPADPMSELERFVETLPSDGKAVLLGSEHGLVFHVEFFLIEFPGRVQDAPDPSHFLPVHRPIDSELAVVLGPTQLTLAGYAQRLYPEAAVTDGRAGNQLLYRGLLLRRADVLPRTGLSLSIDAAGGEAPPAVVADPFATLPAAPNPPQHRVFEGSLYWPSDRPVGLKITSTVPTTVTLAGRILLRPDDGGSVQQVLELPVGWHTLRIEEHVDAPRRLSMTLQIPSGERELTRWDMRPDATREGLYAEYRRDGETVLRAIDPALDNYAVDEIYQRDDELMIRMPFTAAWSGFLRVDQPGTYELSAIGSGPYWIRLDDRELLRADDVVPDQPKESHGSVTLTAGLHPIAAYWDSTQKAHTNRRIFQLFWTPPGGEKVLIPPPQFVRPEGAELQ